MSSLQAFACERTLDYYVGSDLRVFTTLLQHALKVLTGDFGRNRTVDDLTDRSDMLFEINVSFLGNQGWIGGDAIEEAVRSRLANFIKVCSIQKELHKSS